MIWMIASFRNATNALQCNEILNVANCNFSNIWITVVTPSNQHCFQPTVHLLGSCLSVYLAHWIRIYHIGQMRIKKVSGYSVCGIYVNFIAWSDDFNKAKRSKDLTLWDLCHALCTSCTTYIDGWNFRQKKAHTYVHKKGLFTQKSFSTNLRFLKLCMIEEENKRKVHNLARNSKLSKCRIL